MSPEGVMDRLSAALDLVLAGSPSGLSEGDELMQLLGTAAFLRESLTPMPAAEPFRTSLRDWLERPSRPPWWQHLAGSLRHRWPVAGRRPAVGVALGAGVAAAIVIGVLVFRNRRTARGVAG